jgi:hypothetical protein
MLLAKDAAFLAVLSPLIRGATKSVTIRSPITDLERAEEIAGKRGLPLPDLH